MQTTWRFHILYCMMRVNLTSIQQSRYLGVNLSSSITWNHHVNHVVNDANKILGFVRRNLSKCDTNVEIAVYKALVHPKLEYTASVWDPHQAYLVNQREMVQRHTAWFVSNDDGKTSSVMSMLNSLEWPSLQHR